jgi:hypothetical protein
VMPLRLGGGIIGVGLPPGLPVYGSRLAVTDATGGRLLCVSPRSGSPG